MYSSKENESSYFFLIIHYILTLYRIQKREYSDIKLKYHSEGLIIDQKRVNISLAKWVIILLETYRSSFMKE